MCFCAVNCNLNCYLSVDLSALPVIRGDVDSEKGGGGGGRLLFGLVLFLFLSFGIGLYICAVVSFLRLGVVFDFDCAIAQLFDE